MSEPTETEWRTCRFPGCQRPAAASQAGAGRPPEYCDDSAHNRTAAWHARRRLRTEQSGHAAGVDQRLVDAARQRASELHGPDPGRDSARYRTSVSVATVARAHSGIRCRHVGASSGGP